MKYPTAEGTDLERVRMIVLLEDEQKRWNAV